MYAIVLILVVVIVNVYSIDYKNNVIDESYLSPTNSDLSGKNIVNSDEIRYYLTILLNEWEKIKKILNNKEGFLELNNDVKDLIFFKNLLEIEEKSVFCDKETVFSNYSVNWYNNYGFNNIDNISRELFKNYTYDIKCIMKNSDDFVNFSYNRNDENNSVNDIVNKLKLVILFYNQFECDLKEYNNYLKNFDINKNDTLNFNYHCLDKNSELKVKLEDFNKKCNLNENDRSYYLKKIKTNNKAIGNYFWADYYEYYSISKNINSILEFSNKIIMKTNHIIETTKKKIYKKVLYYYIWLIIISKIALYILRKIAMSYIFFDKFIIYIINTIEDYLFMFISLQFIFDIIKTVVAEF
ncbi:hypothetical protein FG379_002170 [Cryptosporidium bovis]|uniref:uncharacterized protein n=1 Tax=Cryptosporidium bovis TaxID=310047 RepID=UPI00351A886B|nr:hypothetical protein FG379_002170 [Cryptosporidium bovis]